jgi:NADH-quinone oxidoreductase subunit N
MTPFTLMAFLPELVLLGGALVLFLVCLGDMRLTLARRVAHVTAGAATVAALLTLGQDAPNLFDGAYRVDLFSQILKLVLTSGFVLVLLLSGEVADIREDVRPEYFLFLSLSVSGLVMLVSCIELMTLVVALELSAFPLYFLVPMRRERTGQRSQMESAVKYMMFGVAASGIMLFGLSYLFGLTGTTSLPAMTSVLRQNPHSLLAVVGLGMAFCGLYYKLAVFPFQFWTPDVYEGASHETAGMIASLPKVGALAVLIRLVSLSPPGSETVATLLMVGAGVSMIYGNFVALAQSDFKRLLGFSGIAHAGYALVGVATLEPEGSAAALYYLAGYVAMVLACFVVISRVAQDGRNLSIRELAGLHRRAPLLALTLLVGVFALAGVPPLVGFMGKFALLTAALAQGYLVIVIVAVLNTAIAIYYYLVVVREAFWRETDNVAPIPLDWPTRALCLLLIAGIITLGLAPNIMLDALAASLTSLNLPVPAFPPGGPGIGGVRPIAGGLLP